MEVGGPQVGEVTCLDAREGGGGGVTRLFI